MAALQAYFVAIATNLRSPMGGSQSELGKPFGTLLAPFAVPHRIFWFNCGIREMTRKYEEAARIHKNRVKNLLAGPKGPNYRGPQ